MKRLFPLLAIAAIVSACTVDPVVPVTPGGVRLIDEGETYLTFGWDTVDGAESYNCSLSGKGARSTQKTSITFDGLDSGQYYTFSVQAVSGELSSAWSEGLTVQTSDFVDNKLGVKAITPDSDAVHAEGGSVTIFFSAPGDWTASASDWISLSATSGRSDAHSLTLTTGENTGGARKGKVTISSGDLTQTVSITQYPRITTMESRTTRHLRWDFNMTYAKNAFTHIYLLFCKPQTNMYQSVKLSQNDDLSVISSSDGVNETWFKHWNYPSDGGERLSVSFEVTSNTIHTDFSKIDGYEDYDKSSSLYKRYTGAETFEGENYVDPDNATIKARAEELWLKAHGDIVEFARKASSWTAANIPYTRMNTGIHPVQDILDNGGDCGNQASIFISLLRAKGIPARHVVLCRVGSAHVRAEFYLAGYGWVPADPNGEQEAPYMDWFGQVDYDADALVVHRGICNKYNLPSIGSFNCLLGQGFCGLWYYWTAPTEFKYNFSLQQD